MSQRNLTPLRSILLSAAGAGLLAACGSGGGSGTAGGGGDFELLEVSVQPGAVWQINKKIEFKFSQAVDFSTVSLQTISVKSAAGASAKGTFSFKPLAGGGQDTTTVVFQPKCPTEPDLSDAGLQPKGTSYKITVLGADAGASSTVKSMFGKKVGTQQTRNFVTPPGTDPTVVFSDTKVGPPGFVPGETFVELGDGTKLEFSDTGGGKFELTDELPLNLFSDASSSVTVVLVMDQPVDPSEANINDERVRIEFEDGAGEWQAIETLVELVANCTASGARLRLRPVGILPQTSRIRVALLPGFEDLPTLESVPTKTTNFEAPTLEIAFQSLTPADDMADELFEDFLIGGTALGSFEDTEAAFDTPTAVWKDGKLAAGFTFEGTGGPGGNFDWHVSSGVILDTTSDQITGGPGGIPATTQNVVGGVVDVRNLWIREGGSVRVQGPNPLVILASGEVRIDGTLDLTGFSASPVGSLFAPDQPEPGAQGAAGGGKGGTGSIISSASTPRGGRGFGAFDTEGGGGQGGETGYSAAGDKHQRRGAGGGGGRFGADEPGTGEGFEAQKGNDGHQMGFGAETGQSPPKGGNPGSGPFSDPDPDNDFWGRKAVFDAEGDLQGVVFGELQMRWAGAGGGAGGDSIKSDTFPSIPFGPQFGEPPATPDKKGAGAGGGGGQLHLQILGPLVFGPGGVIKADGGGGATGANQIGFDHIAGSSAGGSGGHIVIETATQVDFTGLGGALNPGTVENSGADFIRAGGGIGGIGWTSSVGGSTPPEPGGWSKGGNGGPGVVQLHTPETNPALAVGTDPTSAIRVPSGSPMLGSVTSPTGIVLVPSFGARSKARSKWIPLGAAAQNPAGGVDPVAFTFGGTVADDEDPDAGKVVTAGGMVAPHADLLGPETLGTAAPAPFVDSDGVTLVLSQASLAPLIGDVGTPSNDIYLRNPALLKRFVLRLESGSVSQESAVSSATYDDANAVLRVTVDPDGPSLASFVQAFGATNVEYTLRKRFFGVETAGVVGSLPDTAFVRILFQAADADPQGQPGEVVQDWTAEVSKLNELAAGAVDFFRFEVEFDLDTQAQGLTKDTDPVTLDFLRIPFQF